MGFADQIKAWTGKVSRVLEITRSLEGAQWDFQFDPNDPASIEGAVAQAHAQIDERYSPVLDLDEGRAAAAEIKRATGELIRQKAAEMRAAAEPL